MWTKYFNVSDIEQALTHLSNSPETSRIIAGGTDLVLEIERHQHEGVDTLIDISRVRGLDYIELRSDGLIHVGPMATHNDCIGSNLLREKAAPLVQACWNIGSPQIRNRGTVGGNLITASPANDTIPALMVLDAEITLQSMNNRRRISINDFYLGVRETKIKPDEILVDIAFRPLEKSERGVFIKHALRKAQAIALVNLAMILEIESSKILKARLALGAVAPTVFRAYTIEELFQGKQVDQPLSEDIAQELAKIISPISDIRSSNAYRSDMLLNILKKGITFCVKGGFEEILPKEPILLRDTSSCEKTAIHASEHLNKNMIETEINGTTYTFPGCTSKTLLHLIRDDAKLTGTKEGCGEGECGACTILMDGKAVMSCLVPAPRAHKAIIRTIEGVAENGELHPIQTSFIERGAVQCGFCTPGFVMSAVSMLKENPSPSREQIKQGLSGNLCRCTGYYKIIDAIEALIIKPR